MKKIQLLIVLSLLLVFTACTNGDKGGDKNSSASFADIVTQIKEQINEDLKADGVEDGLVDGELTMYFETDLTGDTDEDPGIAMWIERMELDVEDIANGKVIAAMMNINSNELVLLEAKDEKSVESLKASLEKELEAQELTWSQYLPDQHEKVKNNVIKTNGKFLLYVTYDKPENIVKVFDSNFK